MKRKTSVCFAIVFGVLQASSTYSAPQENERIRLQDLVREALERNPEIRAAQRSVDAARSRVSPAGALPDPEVMFGQMNEGNILPFTTLGDPDAGFSEVYAGFNQEFPYPGKRALRRKVAGLEASAEESRYRFTRLRVVSEVKSAFYELYAVHKSLEVVERERSLLEQVEKVASTRYSVGKGIQQDVLDAGVEISRLDERLIALQQRLKTSEALLNSLLDRPNDTPLARPGEIQQSSLAYGLADLTRLAEQNFPLLESEQRAIERDASALDLARKGKYPDFGVTFVYHNRGGNRDYWTIGGTLKIPLYFGSKQRYEIEEAAANAARSRAAYQNTRAQTLYRVESAYLMAETAGRLLKLYDEAILRQSSFSLESAIANYEVGKVDFITLLAAWNRVLNYELTRHEHLAEYQKALAQLEPLVGVELAGE